MNAIVKSLPVQEVLTSEDVVQYTVAHKPFSMDRVQGELPAGCTLSEIAEAAVPDERRRGFLRLYVGGENIDRKLWHRVRPKPGSVVTGRVVPRGPGGGKNPLRLVVMLALVVLTIFTAGALAPLLAVAIGVSVTVAGAIITTAMSVASMLLMNALFPTKKPKLQNQSGQNPQSSPTYFLQGSRNQPNPFGIVPKVLGRHRMRPPYGANPYTEVVGDDQYLRMLFVWGTGPLNIEDLKIGETPISNFQDVEIEHRFGYPSDTPHTLYPGDVFEDPYDIVLKSESGWITRTSQVEADELSIDVSFPRGIAHYTKKGKREAYQVDFNVEYRLVGDSGAWTKAYDASTPLDQQGPTFPSMKAADANTATIRRGLRWKVSTRGQYDVRMVRVTPDITEASVAERTMDEAHWIALRTFTNRSPINLTGLASTAIRIRASDQLNGVVDQLSAIVTSIVPDYDYLTDTWILRATSNPASLYREVLQGAGNARPIADAKVHLEDLKVWHDECRINNREFNQVRDFQSSVWEALSDIAAAGRGSPSFRDGKWTVVVDRPKSTISQHFTPRNSWGFTGDKTFAKMPHGFRIRFVNRDKDWKQDERIVYDDGYDETNATEFEGLELPGVTDPNQIWSDGRTHIAQARLRPERYTINTDMEHLVCTRGDRVKVAHDVPAWGLAEGRIASVVLNGSGDMTGVVLDEFVPMEPSRQYAIRFRFKDNSSWEGSIVTAPGEQYGVTFVTPVAPANTPEPGDLFMAGISTMVTTDCLVLAIQPGRDLVAKLTLVDYAPDVFTAGSGAIPPFNSNISPVPGASYPVVSDIRSDENVLQRNNDGSLSARIALTFAFVGLRASNVTAVELQYKHQDGDDNAWSALPSLNTNVRDTYITNVDEGQAYEIRTRYRLSNGDPGNWSPVITHTVIGKSTPPVKPVNFRLDGGQLLWDYPEPAVDHWGFYLRYAFGQTTDWEQCQPLHPAVWADSPFELPATITGNVTLMVKAVDVAGNVSTEPSTIFTGLGDRLTDNVVEEFDYAAAGYPGVITNGYVSPGSPNQLRSDLVTAVYWVGPSTSTYWGVSDSLFWTGTLEERIWEFSYSPDAGVVGDDSTLNLIVNDTVPPSKIEFRENGNALFWGLDSTALMWSMTDPNETFWTDLSYWRLWLGKTFGLSRQEYRWRITTPSAQEDAPVFLDTALVVVDVPDITESHENFVTAAGTGSRLALTKQYRRIKNIQLTQQDDGGTARSVKYYDKDVDLGPLLGGEDSVGAIVAASMDIVIQGY